MKKYLFIFKSELMSNISYIFNMFSGFIGYFVHIFIFFQLWMYLYSDPSELISGYTINEMVWYVILTEVLWSAVSGRKLCRKISNDVKGGNIAYNINKPYNYIGYALSSHLGDSIIGLGLYMIVGALTGLLFLHSFPSINILGLIIVFISIVFAVVIGSLLSMCIGLLSFIIEDSSPLYWLYSKVILIVGTVFPIEFFPTFVQPILKLSPSYVVCYGPAKLFVDFSYKNAWVILLAQVGYLLFSYLLCYLVYRKGVRNLNVNGG